MLQTDPRLLRDVRQEPGSDSAAAARHLFESIAVTAPTTPRGARVA